MVRSVTDKLEKSAAKKQDEKAKMFDKNKADTLEDLGDVGQATIDDYDKHN